jgi:hypothetical protein
MSNTFGSLLTTGISAGQGDRYKIDTLFKKLLGYANTNVPVGSEYPEDATSRVAAKYVQTQTIPDEAPKSLGTAVTPSGEIYKVYTPTGIYAQYSYIKKYEDVDLSSSQTAPNGAFVCNINDANGVSLLKNVIPMNYGKGGYTITVKVGTNTVNANNYILDRDAGIITIYGFSQVSSTNLPKITFWRYEGTYGFDNIASNFSIGDVSGGAVGSAPVVTFSDTVGGGKAFNFTLPAPYSGVDGIDGSDAKQVIISGVDFQTTTNPADVSGYFVAGTETATTKPYTLHLVVKDGVDGQDGAQGVAGAPGKDVQYAILNYQYTFNPIPSITNNQGTFYSISVPKGLNYSAGQDIVICSKETPETATPNKLYADITLYQEHAEPATDASLNFIVTDILTTSSAGWSVQKQYDINVNETPAIIGGWQSGNNAQTQTFNLRDIGIGVSSPEAALDVSGAVKFRDALAVASDISGAGALRVAGAADLKSTLTVASDISGEGELRVAGAVDLKSTLSVADDISGAGDLYVGGNIYLGGTFKDSAGNSIQLADGFNATYNDAYFNTNLRSTPPAPTLKDTSDSLYINGNYKQYQTLTEIGFSFNNPAQTAFGDMWVPHIKSVRVEVSGVAIIDLCESLIPKTGNEITAIILSKITGTDGKYTRTIKSNGNNISETAFIKYGISSSFASGTIVKIGYRNNLNNSSADINYLSVPLETFIAAFPPVAPSNVGAITPNSAFAANNTNISWSAPPFVTKDPETGAGINQAGIVFDGYKVDVSETGIVAGTKRFGTTATAYNKVIIIPALGATPTSTSFTATPRTNYSITVSAKNNQNTSYGDVSSNVHSTGYPAEPINGPSNTLSYPTENYTAATIRAVGAGSDVAISSPVYRVGPTYTHSFEPTNTLTGIKLHKLSNAGDIMTRTVTFTGTRSGTNLFTEVMSVSGDFINNSSYVNTSLSKVKITSLQKSDNYTGDLSGYYQLFSMKPVLDLSNNAATFPASTGEYTFTITFDGDNSSRTSSFYLEDFNTTLSPSITVGGGYTLSVNNKKKVSGIEIAQSNDPVTYVKFNDIQVSNIGKYFYNSLRIYQITAPSFFTGTTAISALPTTPPTTAPISTLTYTSSPNITINSGNGSYTVKDNIIFTLNALNINGNVSSDVTVDVPIRFDRKTYEFSYNNSIISVGNTSTVYRIEYRNPSDGLISSSPYYTTYDNNEVIVNNSSKSRYNNEIIMWEGLFRFENTTPTGAYSTIESETGFRYITFAWDGPKSGNVGDLQFKLLNFFSESNSPTLNIGSVNSNNTYVVYYRLEHVLNGTVQQPTPGNNTIYSTYWMEATSTLGVLNMGTNYANQKGTSGFADTNGLGDSGALSTAYETPFTNTSGTVTHYVWSPSRTYSATNYVHIYLTIGIKANTHRFGRVECTYT